MAIDVSKFHNTFFEESLEGLELMESGLLDLEVGASNTEAINTIFRAAHSIKGGAGTFGFTAVTDFTHLVETILDRRRSGQAEVTQEAIEVLLESVDCLRELLSATRTGGDADLSQVADVQARLQSLIDADPTSGGPAAGHPVAAAPDQPASTVGQGWRITFKPFPHLFRTGNDPARILGELAELGDYTVRADTSALPELEDLDIETCYSSWDISLATPADRAAVDQIFEWVADDAEITVTPIEGDPTAADNLDPAADAAGTGIGTAPAGTADDGHPAADGDERRSGADRRGAETHAPTTTSIRVDIEKIDTLINMVGELVITQSMLQQVADHTTSDIDLDKFREGLADLERNTRELQGSVMQIRMLPISFAFSRLPRLARDLSSKLGKKAELKIHGETTELDKTVLEKIGDPLIHLVRNALDHGLETPEGRRAAGKPETGRVELAAFHEGGNIVIEISDDGGGLPTRHIAAKARERGLIGDDDQLTDKQIHDLIFHPGLSTAETVSDISGRGVGMDVVKRNINDLGGVIEVHSTAGQGTRFRIRLPLTLAILDGQVVRVGSQVFIVPLVSIVESIQFDQQLTASLVKGAGVYRHRGEAIPVLRLGEVFHIPPSGEASGQPLLVVVEADGTRAGIAVDDLLAQQQIVIKSLKTNFRPVPGLSGATILGDGTVAMILDVNSVLALYRQTLPAAERTA